MAAIRSQRLGSECFWEDRIRGYLSGEHSPQRALSTRAAFVAANGDEVIGFAAVHLTRRFGCEGELQWIDVSGETRARGIGHKLMGRIGAWLEEQKATRICVNVDPGNTIARMFYTKCGASQLNEHWMIWDDIRTMSAPDASKFLI